MEKAQKSTRVKVIARVRPLLSPDDKAHVYALDDSTVETFNHRNLKENLQYQFHRVFDEHSTQSDVFGYIQPMLANVFEGQNASVLAYGPTGAGKTHTMQGSESDPGVITRCISHMFDHINHTGAQNTGEHTVKISYLEIYNEKVQDLLEPKSQDLPIREDRHKQIFVTGLAEKIVTSLEDFNQMFLKASRHRTVAATKLNERSSRSHTVLCIKVEKKEKNRLLTGKLQLVDLAGSENNKRTGNKGIRLTESGAINKSLHALGQVVDALNHHRLVPYRDSKLTRMLQDSLGGNSHTLMVINIAPDQYWETYSTLNFAQKSKRIVNNTYATETKVAEEDRRSATCSPAEHKQSLSPQPTAPAVRPPFLSPLIRVENTLHETTNRLQALEQALIKQMQDQYKTQGVKVAPPSVNRKLTAEIENIKKNLEEFKKKRKSTEPPKLTFDSPLLFKKSTTLKRKGFVSSAAPKDKHRKVEDENNSSWQPNADLQEKHNNDILHILNTGSIQNLQSLQTVGKKRAQLIHDWRQLNGGVKEITDLENIPGLTLKWTHTFMKNNLVKV